MFDLYINLDSKLSQELAGILVDKDLRSKIEEISSLLGNVIDLEIYRFRTFRVSMKHLVITFQAKTANNDFNSNWAFDFEKLIDNQPNVEFIFLGNAQGRITSERVTISIMKNENDLVFRKMSQEEVEDLGPEILRDSGYPFLHGFKITTEDDRLVKLFYKSDLLADNSNLLTIKSTPENSNLLDGLLVNHFVHKFRKTQSKNSCGEIPERIKSNPIIKLIYG